MRLLLPWLAIACLACASTQATSAPARHPAATLELVVTNPSITQAWDLSADYVIHNTGNVPLWVNRRMAVGLEGLPSLVNEIRIDVTGPADARWSCQINIGFPNWPDYTFLRPGESVGRKRGPDELGKCVYLMAPGDYTLVAHYQDGGTATFAPPGTVHLDWELVSPPVVVHIGE